MPPSGSTQLNRAIALVALLCAALLTGCCTRPTAVEHAATPWEAAPIQVSLHAATRDIRIGDMSQRELRPEAVVWRRDSGICVAEKDRTAETDAWLASYTAPLDLEVELSNTGDREIALYWEGNSWGYYNLKFVFADYNGHEWLVAKQPGMWYRNFPSWTTLAPGESMRIQVALAPFIWQGMDEVTAHAAEITQVRAIYEQGIASSSSPWKSTDPTLWRGIVTSKPVSAAELLPRFGFKPQRPPVPLQEMKKTRMTIDAEGTESGLIIE